MSASVLEQLQLDVAGYLAADEYFSDVPVFALRPRENADLTEIQTRIDAALACSTLKNGRGGAAVTVLMPLVDVAAPNVAGPQLVARLTVRVQELPALNMSGDGTGKSAENIALVALSLLHQFSNGFNTLLAAREALTPSLEFEPRITYDVNFEMRVSRGQIERVSPVTISFAGGQVSLLSNTSGASIYYTLDGSFPGPDKTLYSAPFAAPASGTLVRTAAYKTGLAGSNVSEAIAP